MEKILKLDSNVEAIALYGSLDQNLRFAEKEYQVRISAQNHQLKISGDKSKVEAAYDFFLDRLRELRGEIPPAKVVKEAPVSAKPEAVPAYEGRLGYFHRGRMIRARSRNQDTYLEAMQSRDIVVCIGPAGTGKTYLAMAAAIDQLRRQMVSRIVLTRPAVEAGESLGFLPGDLQAKVNPYLRPLYDALYDMMDSEEATRNLERNVIEVAPLAYMRGRTINDSFIILDEAQNCTPLQMKMFLTRLGASSRAVITGDVTQIDLPQGKRSGLVEIQEILSSIKGIEFVQLRETDVVRHYLVREIIKAYDRYEHRNG